MTSPRVVRNGAKVNSKLPGAASELPPSANGKVVVPRCTKIPVLLKPPSAASKATSPRAFVTGALKKFTYCPPAGAASPEAAMTVCVTWARASAADRNWMHAKTMKVLMKIGAKRARRFMMGGVLSLPPEDQCRCSRGWWIAGPLADRSMTVLPFHRQVRDYHRLISTPWFSDKGQRKVDVVSVAALVGPHRNTRLTYDPIRGRTRRSVCCRRI